MDIKANEVVVTSTEEIGKLIKSARNKQNLSQLMLSGLFGSGNRFVIDAEHGKKTLQAQKLMDLLGILGFEVVIRRK